MLIVVEGFERDGEELASEHPLLDPDERQLAGMLGLDDAELLYAFTYELAQEQLAYLVQRYGLRLSDEPQVYFLTSFADESGSP